MLSDLIWEVYSDKGKDYDEEQFFIDVEDYEKLNGNKEISKLLKLGNNDLAAYKLWKYFLFTDYVSPLFNFQHVKDLTTEQKAKVLDELEDLWLFITNFKWCSKPMKNIKIYKCIDGDVKAMFFEAVQKHASELGHYESEDDKERFFREYKSKIKDIFKCRGRVSSTELKKQLQPIANKAVWLKHCDEH